MKIWYRISTNTLEICEKLKFECKYRNRGILSLFNMLLFLLINLTPPKKYSP